MSRSKPGKLGAGRAKPDVSVAAGGGGGAGIAGAPQIIAAPSYAYFFGKVVQHVPLEDLTSPFPGFTSSAV